MLIQKYTKSWIDDFIQLKTILNNILIFDIKLQLVI
jgi:hypothetical protein